MVSPIEPYLGQGRVTPYPKREVAARIIWSIVQATIFRWSPRPWHRLRVELLRWFGAEIPEPDKVRIFPTVAILFPWRLTIHPRVMVGPNVRLYNIGCITLEYGANIAQHAHLCAGTHDYRRWDMPLLSSPIHVGKNVWICAEAFIGPGVTIGELTIIGARAVAVSNQPARKICAGQPCRPLKDRPTPI